MSPRAKISRPRQQVSCFFVSLHSSFPVFSAKNARSQQRGRRQSSAPLAESDYSGIIEMRGAVSPAPLSNAPSAPIASTSREMNRSMIDAAVHFAAYNVRTLSAIRHRVSPMLGTRRLIRCFHLVRTFLSRIALSRSRPLLSVSGLLPK